MIELHFLLNFRTFLLLFSVITWVFAAFQAWLGNLHLSADPLSASLLYVLVIDFYVVVYSPALMQSPTFVPFPVALTPLATVSGMATSSTQISISTGFFRC
jgi:hypothetical protein